MLINDRPRQREVEAGVRLGLTMMGVELERRSSGPEATLVIGSDTPAATGLYVTAR